MIARLIEGVPRRALALLGALLLALIAAPLVVIYFFAQRRFIEGITFSGIRG
jgi:ABC-type glycerol-3-phosphate transport system permease component